MTSRYTVRRKEKKRGGTRHAKRSRAAASRNRALPSLGFSHPALSSPYHSSQELDTDAKETKFPPFAKPVAPSDGAAPWVTMGVSVVVEKLDKKQRLRLLMALVAEETGLVTPFSVVVGAGSALAASDFSYDDIAAAGVEDPLQVGRRLLSGTMLSGSVQVPADLGAVGAVLLRVEKGSSFSKGKDDDDDVSLYVGEIRLDVPGEKKAADDVYVRSYLMPQQRTRVFFSRRASIPQAAPKALAPYRKGDLAIMCGDYVSLDRPDLIPQTPYKSHDRVYRYDVYNDLGRPDGTDCPRTRPTLGGKGCVPYPRRLKTGRAITSSGEEIAPEGDAYLPRNEQFTKQAAQDFVRAAIFSTVSGYLRVFNVRQWDDFAEAVDWFNDGSFLQKKGSFLQKLIKALRKWSVASAGVQWPVPRVLVKRVDAWKDDAEFGRQLVAGQNPVAVEAATRSRLALTSFLDAPPSLLGRKQLGGATLEELVAAGERDPVRGGRLFMVDFATPTILEYAEMVNADEKSGKARMVGTRCLLIAGEDRVLRPVAIELVRSRNDPNPQLVTPADGAALWLLAKMYVASSDSGHHALISHWLKSHACTEPYIIAAKRCLSQAHPIMRLLQKHFYYTLQINGKARGNLINRDGVVEASFTPGARCLELSAAAYRDGWSFEGEALPADLVNRGMAVGDASPGGAGVTLVHTLDYPYAEDGLALWKILEDWTTEFVSIYYADDTAVASDPELSAFWMEVTTIGHGDIERGWPALTSVQSLVRCLTTIVYNVSAFHAAINFTQYDFAGTLLNRPSRTRLDFPRPHEPAFAELSCAPGQGASRAQEKLIMAHLTDAESYMRNAAVLSVLSTHDQAEHYLGAPDPWMDDPAAPAVASLYANLGCKLESYAKMVAARNEDRSRAARCGGGVLDYRLLLPTSPPGMTSQGVPNSVSI